MIGPITPRRDTSPESAGEHRNILRWSFYHDFLIFRRIYIFFRWKTFEILYSGFLNLLWRWEFVVWKRQNVCSSYSTFYTSTSSASLWNFGGKWRHWALGTFSLVFTCQPVRVRGSEQAWIGTEGPGSSFFPHRKLQRPLSHSWTSQIYQRIPCQTSGNVAGGPLPGGRETPRTTLRSSGQIQSPKEVSPPQDDMGRGTEDALLQREDKKPAQRMVPTGPLPEPDQKERTGFGYRTDAYPSGKLVQEQATKRQGGCS